MGSSFIFTEIFAFTVIMAIVAGNVAAALKRMGAKSPTLYGWRRSFQKRLPKGLRIALVIVVCVAGGVSLLLMDSGTKAFIIAVLGLGVVIGILIFFSNEVKTEESEDDENEEDESNYGKRRKSLSKAKVFTVLLIILSIMAIAIQFGIFRDFNNVISMWLPE